MTDVRRCAVFAGVLVVFVTLTMLVGCARLKRGPASRTEKPETAATQGSDAPEPVYYDFEDVLVPSELKEDQKRSFVYHAPGFTAGVLVLSGRVEMSSLVRFFENNMAKDNWRLLSLFKSPRTIMFFNKPNRSCIINITGKHFKSEVEIWVAPTMEDHEEAGLLN